MEHASTIGIDLGKRVFYACGMNEQGRVLYRKRLFRSDLLNFMREQEKCVVGMEACGGSHHWGREFMKLGHEVKLMPGQYVKPYVKRNKNDTNDAEGCAEAVSRATMRFVSVKTEWQEELQQLHRVRERLMKNRTALGNQMRSFLFEYGVALPEGFSKLRVSVMESLLEYGEQIPPVAREIIERELSELDALSEEVSYYDDKLKSVAKEHPVCEQLMTIPGVGVLTATAIVALVSNIEDFKNGRQFAAFLGLVPKQTGTGGKTRLGGISKRGNSSVRKLLVQGAHSVLVHAKKKNDRMSQWVVSIQERRGTCRAAVAVANKNARIIWALMARGTNYEVNHRSASGESLKKAA